MTVPVLVTDAVVPVAVAEGIGMDMDVVAWSIMLIVASIILIVEWSIVAWSVVA